MGSNIGLQIKSYNKDLDCAFLVKILNHLMRKDNFQSRFKFLIGRFYNEG